MPRHKRKGDVEDLEVLADSKLIDRVVARTRRLTQVEASRQTGVGQKTISRWRAGRRAPLQAGTRQALVAFLADRVQVSGAPGPETRAAGFDAIAVIVDQVRGRKAGEPKASPDPKAERAAAFLRLFEAG